MSDLWMEPMARAAEAFYYMPALNGAYEGATVEEIRAECDEAINHALVWLHRALGRPLTDNQQRLADIIDRRLPAQRPLTQPPGHGTVEQMIGENGCVGTAWYGVFET